MRKINIGGEEAKEGWEIFNIVPEDCVDHVGDARDMSRFEDETFDVIYASHILEHLDYDNAPDGSFFDALKEWKRVLKTGGKLLVAVPNMDKLCEMFLDKKYDIQERIKIVKFIFGGHSNKYDYHYLAFDADLLSAALQKTGFRKIWKVDRFNLFNDSSMGHWGGREDLSLNVVAEKG
jgi:predicted SAM-dependent methyltransferase